MSVRTSICRMAGCGNYAVDGKRWCDGCIPPVDEQDPMLTEGQPIPPKPKPMSDERFEYLGNFIKMTIDKLPSGDINANHWSHTGLELWDEIDRLRAEVERLNEQISHLSDSHLEIQRIEAEHQDRALTAEKEVERLKEVMKNSELSYVDMVLKLRAHEAAMRKICDSHGDGTTQRDEDTCPRWIYDKLSARLEKK